MRVALQLKCRRAGVRQNCRWSEQRILDGIVVEEGGHMRESTFARFAVESEALECGSG